MGSRASDGSAGDTDYAVIGGRYGRYRVADPRIASAIDDALGPARTVLNVGAGAGSYEPVGRDVTAVEPSASMRAQRPAGLPAALDAAAERLPFPDETFDAAMTTFSVHQWGDLDAGLSEMRRVTRGPVVILTGDPERLDGWWLAEYCAEVIEAERGRYPSIDRLAAGLGGSTTSRVVPVPFDCTDGFNEAYYGRPEALLDKDARLACSAWGFVPAAATQRFVTTLAADLANGTWDARFGSLRTQPVFDGSLVLVVSIVGGS